MTIKEEKTYFRMCSKCKVSVKAILTKGKDSSKIPCMTCNPVNKEFVEVFGIQWAVQSFARLELPEDLLQRLYDVVGDESDRMIFIYIHKLPGIGDWLIIYERYSEGFKLKYCEQEKFVIAHLMCKGLQMSYDHVRL